MNYKKITATLLTAVLVVANCVPAFAGTADGTGAVEYDNSVTVTYDKIQVPTLADSTYDFTLDPQDLLHTFAPGDYELDSKPGVYFKSVKTAASIEPKTGTGAVEIFKLSKSVTADDADKVVTAVDTDGNVTAISTTDKYYVWTPTDITGAVEGTTPTGKTGQYTVLTEENVGNYFDVKEATGGKYTITIKGSHRSGDYVCDGNLYKDVYTKIDAKVTDN